MFIYWQGKLISLIDNKNDQTDEYILNDVNSCVPVQLSGLNYLYFISKIIVHQEIYLTLF